MQTRSSKGHDCEGNEYNTLEQMWEVELDPKNKSKIKNKIGSVENWYKKQSDYWKSQEASVNGVLGGYENLHEPDINHSKGVGNGRVLDCGAGIGRITKNLLQYFFQVIDISDQNELYLEEAKKQLEGINVENFIHVGLQSLNPPHLYDCIWIQWVSNYLTDDDLLKFLVNSSQKLTPGGIIVVKENLAGSNFVVDKSDASVTRTEAQFCKVFQKANLKILQQSYQQPWPEDLFKVKAFVLVPDVEQPNKQQ